MNSTIVGIIGPSGSGKSTSFFPEEELGIVGLNPKETFVINVAGKPFPFKGWRKAYIPMNAENPQGNYFNTEDASVIVRTMLYVNESRPEIKNIVIDDLDGIKLSLNSVNCLENPEMGNQQPSSCSDTEKGSTTSSKSQVDNNSTTKAGQYIIGIDPY